jgi:uncharacterized membrane protein
MEGGGGGGRSVFAKVAANFVGGIAAFLLAIFLCRFSIAGDLFPIILPFVTSHKKKRKVRSMYLQGFVFNETVLHDIRLTHTGMFVVIIYIYIYIYI